VAGFTEGLLALTEQLLGALESGRERPPPEDLAAMRAGLERWQAALEGIRRRIAALTTTPRDRMQ